VKEREGKILDCLLHLMHNLPKASTLW